MTDWAHLKELDTTALYTFSESELAQPWGAYAAAIYGDVLNIDASTRVLTPICHTIDATAVDSMATAIGSLPGEGESVHLWIGGRHSMGHVIAAMLQHAEPAIIDVLHVATLTFSKENADEWASMIDAGKIGALAILCSQYFEKTSTGIFQYASGILSPRGVRIIAVRSHCKLVCARLSDGRMITAEGSANTRSAKTCEQVTIFGSPAVYQFHVDQIERTAAIKAAAIVASREAPDPEQEHANA